MLQQLNYLYPYSDLLSVSTDQMNCQELKTMPSKNDFLVLDKQDESGDLLVFVDFILQLKNLIIHS